MKKSIKKLESKSVKNVKAVKGGNNEYGERQDVMEEWVYVVRR